MDCIVDNMHCLTVTGNLRRLQYHLTVDQFKRADFVIKLDEFIHRYAARPDDLPRHCIHLLDNVYPRYSAVLGSSRTVCTACPAVCSM